MWRVHIPFLPDFVLLLCKYDAPCSKLKPYRSSHFHSKKLYNSNTSKFSGEFKVKQGTLTFHYFEHDICMGYGRYQLGSLTPRGSHYCVKKESQSNRYLYVGCNYSENYKIHRLYGIGFYNECILKCIFISL